MKFRLPAYQLVIALGLSAVLSGCFNKSKQTIILLDQDGYVLTVPVGLDSMSVPENNQLSIERIALGRKLFYDPVMSRDSSVSCATCHMPEKYFTDGLARSKGIKGLEVDRNAPSLYNVGYHPRFLREGGVPTLEMQILVPIQEHREFDYNIVDLATRLQSDSEYVRMAAKAYNREMDPFVITRAISAYERTLLSGNSAYDRYVYGGEKRALNRIEKEGMKLFFSERLKCAHCHSGFNFTNYQVVCNGLYAVYADSGKARLTTLPEDRGKFKVPGLRNVAETAPYMHDGSLKTLQQVVDHYARGGAGHPNQSPLVAGFDLSPDEKTALVAFLKSLTGGTQNF